jgi:hypothetical protein
MASVDYFNKVLNKKNESYEEFNASLKKHKFIVSNNSFSSYNTTYLTLASIFNMSYFDKNYKYSNRNDLFPKLLYKKEPPKLIHNLNKIGYDFVYYGNMWAKCEESYHFSCSNEVVNTDPPSLGKKISNYLDNAGIKVFTQRSVLGFFIRKYISIYADMLNPDGLDSFMNNIDSIKPYSKKFYFIHNLAPHPPFPNKDCEIDYTKNVGTWIDTDVYSQSVKCALKKTLVTIDKILLIDPNAIIVIQGDHGPGINYKFDIHPHLNSKEALLERFSIHNSIRIPRKCSTNDLDKIGNIETVNLVFNCISNVEEVGFKNRSFAGSYETNKETFGSLIEVTSLLK